MTNFPFPTKLDACSKMVAAIRWGMLIGATIAALVIALDGRPGGLAAWWPDGLQGGAAQATHGAPLPPEGAPVPPEGRAGDRALPTSDPAASGRKITERDEGRAGLGPAGWSGGASGLFAQPRRQP